MSDTSLLPSNKSNPLLATLIRMLPVLGSVLIGACLASAFILVKFHLPAIAQYTDALKSCTQKVEKLQPQKPQQ